MKTFSIRIVFSIFLATFAVCIPSLLWAAPPSLLMGMCASTNDGSQVFPMMKQLGVTSIRTDVPWSQVETTKGHYSIPPWVESSVSAAIASGMEPLLILDYGSPLYTNNDKPLTPAERTAFANYASYVVSYFKGRVQYFELWNEWETHTGDTTPGTAQDYIALAKVVYPALRKANPAVKVLAGGVSDLYLSQINTGYIADFLRGDGMSYADGLSLHPYNEPGDDGTPETAIQLVDAVYDLSKTISGTASVAIYITEMGYSTYSGTRGVSADDEANYLARFMALAASRSYISGVWWYNFKNAGVDPTSEEQNFGLVDASLKPKPAATMYAAVVSSIKSSNQISTTLVGGTYTATAQNSIGSQVISWEKDHSDVMTYGSDNPAKRFPLIQFARPSSVDALRVTTGDK